MRENTDLLFLDGHRTDIYAKGTNAINEHTEPNVENIEAMFVQCAQGMTCKCNGTVTFQGPAHSTFFFAGRCPNELWATCIPESLSMSGVTARTALLRTPPNAVVSFLEEGDTVPEEVTIELRDPHFTEETLTYNVKVLDGTLAGPRRGNAASSLTQSAGHCRQFGSWACVAVSAAG